jgi:hypothetical protein
MTSSHVPTPLEIGDRVTTRISGNNYSNAGMARRYGEIVGFTNSKNTRGSKTTYVQVRWDGHTAPSTHMRHRIVHASKP